MFSEITYHLFYQLTVNVEKEKGGKALLLAYFALAFGGTHTHNKYLHVHCTVELRYFEVVGTDLKSST